MFDEKRHQPDCLEAQLLAHQPIAAGRLVAFVEEQVERLQHRLEPRREF